MNFLHTYIPNPILIDIGFLSIRWYGFFIVLGILVSLFIVFKLSKKFIISSDEIYDLLFWLAIGGLLGARLYEVVFINFDYSRNICVISFYTKHYFFWDYIKIFITKIK